MYTTHLSHFRLVRRNVISYLEFRVLSPNAYHVAERYLFEPK